MKIRNYYFWVAAVSNICIDIISKRAIVENLRIERTSFPIVPNILHFTYIRNHGAAFSLLEGQLWLRWLSLIVSVILIGVGIFKVFSNIWEQLGFGLILAGAAGNGIDRLFFNGSVVDFIDLRFINFAIFNWADVSINLGIVCLLIHSFFYQPQQSNR
ncbi:signal peptidase II [Chamaesiphon sp. OTE_75_metabat_556]|uniref:signal peptidase II n=1 Tax=Chamaesiphon sp. OTE_75_metabat_556 TaxID=2964692 RepID=UPI00286A8068|nr:signal peptidase II [Chamaesiphon sp. OTE_75_metabat_556]